MKGMSCTTRLSFESVRLEIANDNNKVAVLKLANPLIEVIGSKLVPAGIDGTQGPLVQYNVTEIRVHSDEWNKGFRVYNSGKITYQGNNILDVTSKGQIWLVKEKFSTIERKLRASTIVENIMRRSRGNNE